MPPSPVILWIELGGKSKWLPLNFRCHGVVRTTSIVYLYSNFLLFLKVENRRDPLSLEAALMLRVPRHQNIITLHDFLEKDDGLILVLERPEPVNDLFLLIEQAGAFNIRAAKFLFKQVVEAAAHCHASGVFHQDIKPDNVIVELRTGRAILIDFGSGDELRRGYYNGVKGKVTGVEPLGFFFNLSSMLSALSTCSSFSLIHFSLSHHLSLSPSLSLCLSAASCCSIKITSGSFRKRTANKKPAAVADNFPPCGRLKRILVKVAILWTF